jgi:hypothetical protein
MSVVGLRANNNLIFWGVKGNAGSATQGVLKGGLWRRCELFVVFLVVIFVTGPRHVTVLVSFIEASAIEKKKWSLISVRVLA